MKFETFEILLLAIETSLNLLQLAKLKVVLNELLSQMSCCIVVMPAGQMMLVRALSLQMSVESCGLPAKERVLNWLWLTSR